MSDELKERNILKLIGAGSATDLGMAAVHELTIDGANMTMTSCTSGAGVGSGFANLTGTSIVNDLTVQGGAVTTNLFWAGIRSGLGSQRGVSVVQRILMTDRTVIVTVSDGAGVGSGFGCSEGYSHVGLINFTHNADTAKGAVIRVNVSLGAGSAHGVNGVSHVGTVEVYVGDIEVNGNLCASIGSGFAENGGLVDAEIIAIAGGWITANLSLSAGIGTGACPTRGSRSQTLQVMINYHSIAIHTGWPASAKSRTEYNFHSLLRAFHMITRYMSSAAIFLRAA